MAYYFGALGGAKFEVFTSKKSPTQKSHGHKYKYVTGPYKNRAAAELGAQYQGVVVNLSNKEKKPFDGNFGTGYIGNPKLKALDKNDLAEYYAYGEYVIIVQIPISYKSKYFNWEVRKGSLGNSVYVNSGNSHSKIRALNDAIGNIKNSTFKNPVKKKKGNKRPVNINAIIGAIKSPKTPKHLKEGLKRKYGHLLK